MWKRKWEEADPTRKMKERESKGFAKRTKEEGGNVKWRKDTEQSRKKRKQRKRKEKDSKIRKRKGQRDKKKKEKRRQQV